MRQINLPFNFNGCSPIFDPKNIVDTLHNNIVI